VLSTNFCREFAAFWSKFLPPYGASFAALWQEFFRLLVRVLPPFGGSFAAFWWEFSHLLVGVYPSYVKFLTRSTNVCRYFLGAGGCKSLS